MESGVTLADIRKEETLQRNCTKVGIVYIPRTANETEQERDARHHQLQLAIKSKRRIENKSQQSPDKERRIRESNVHAQRRHRANLSTEQQHNARRINAASMQQQRTSLSPEQQESARRINTATRQQLRANLSPEQQRNARRINAASMQQQRASLSPEQQESARRINTASRQQLRANLSPEQQESARQINTASRRRQREMQQAENDVINDYDDIIPDPPTKEHIDSLVQEAIKQVTRTRRDDGSHQATVCVVCDCLIIGEEKVHLMPKERLENNRNRLSVETYEQNFGEMHPLLIEQYQVAGLEGMLLSPRSYRSGDNFECCASCFSSTKPSSAEKSSKPPKFAIANGFAIGHLPSILQIQGEDEPRQIDLDESKLSDLMCVAMSTQRYLGYVFAFTGGAQQSVMGNFTFFETDQVHMGSVINHYRSIGANDHLLCVMCGRFTKTQRQIAREQATLNTKLYVDLMTWFIRESNHPAYQGLTPPESCPAPQIIEDAETDNNTDQPQNPQVENQYQGGTFTFTSSNDPTESTGTYTSNTSFAAAMMNQSSPLLLVRGGDFVNARDLLLENVFPVQFPFGTGGPKLKRPTAVSEEACLQHYMRLSQRQFMRGDFILVVLTMMNRKRSFQTGIITARARGLNGQQTLAETISTLTAEQIQAAAQNIDNNIEDNSAAANFLRRANTSCRSIGYMPAAASKNRRLMYGLCDRYGIPHIFFTISPDDACNWRVRLFANAGCNITMPSLDCDESICILDCKMRRDARIKYPGACATEYRSIIQTLIKRLFCWDTKKQKGGKGIFGTMIAFAVAHEEQSK